MNYIYSDNLSSLDNMILDSYLTQQCIDEYFRMYKWVNHTLSLGITNNMNEINSNYINNNNIDIVRRETGGGFVFHTNDLCFSFITNKNLKPKENYLFIKNTIEKLLLNLDMVVTNTYDINIKSPICFMGSGKHEISVNNKKVIAIAQRVMKNRYLIQGSIQIGKVCIGQLFNTSRKIVQHGLNDINFSTIKEQMYDEFAKIHKLNNILDTDIILTKDYSVFKNENKHKFKEEF